MPVSMMLLPKVSRCYAGDDTWLSFADAIPIIVTTLDRLQQHRPMGPVWWRFGQPGARSLTDALDHWDDHTEYGARREAARAKAAEEQRRYRESRRCPTRDQLPDDGWYSANSCSHKPCEECDRRVQPGRTSPVKGLSGLSAHAVRR